MVFGSVRRAWDRFRAYIYDVIIVAVTSVWYREFLTQCCPPDSSILDVGIGTATSLVANRDVVRTKRLKIHGVDYDQGYIDAAEKLVTKHQLNDCISLTCASIHDYRPSLPCYDVVYFSGSFMIIPDKEKALRSVCAMLQDPDGNGRVCFTQTFERPGVVGTVMKWVKPFFKFLLTIDFGGVTYEADFRRTLQNAGMTIESMKVIRGSFFRKQVLVVAKKR
jgi:ubiquinone/menaquinone biosynthesis C-methylase UbiE